MKHLIILWLSYQNWKPMYNSFITITLMAIPYYSYLKYQVFIFNTMINMNVLEEQANCDAYTYTPSISIRFNVVEQDTYLCTELTSQLVSAEVCVMAVVWHQLEWK